MVGAGGLAVVALLASCGSSDKSTTAATVAPTVAPVARTTVPPPNACPADGCRIRIVSATKAGDEIQLAFEANYTADVSRNHFHVYWDTWTAKQVSNDAEPRFGVRQGDWVPTADNPFTTTDAVSVKKRGQSTKVCVTAGDRDHNVLNPDLVDCRDVSGLL
jgi:hypothetical protein